MFKLKKITNMQLTFTIRNKSIVFVAKYLCMFRTLKIKVNVDFDTTLDNTKQ